MEKNSGKTNRNFNSRMQARLLLVFCVVTLTLIGLMVRLVYIVQVDGDRYAKKVLSRQSYVSSVLPYKRGDILDRNGTVLATSELQYRLILDPKLLLQNSECIEPTIKALQSIFGVDAATVQQVLDSKPDSQYVILLKELKYDVVQSFKTLMEEDKDNTIIGVWFEEQYVRTYPYNSLACDVLGFTSADNIGFWGIEEYYNSELNGTNGREYGYYDSELDLERIVKKAVNGNSVISSIDANVQRIIQEKIVEFNKETGSKSIGVLVMNPNNGEILAMASNQEYDLNNPQSLEGIYTKKEIKALSDEQKTKALNTLWKNDVISSGFEPGSTFKPITIAAALEESIIASNATYYCDGSELVGGSTIHCSKRVGHGELTLTQSLMFSCNDAMMQIVAKEGKDIFYRYENDFGMGKKTGIDLPGEEAGLIIAKDGLNATELATSSFGQSFTTTMLQMATAFSSLVNGGSYYQPHVVKEIVNDSGATVKENDGVVVRQTVSEQTSDFIQQALYKTVEEGTAQGAKVEGYAVGGKTGTAQKLPRDAKTYVVSFLGCVPAINPEIVIYVIVDEPQNVLIQADSSIATKFASKILKEILPALDIYPEGDIDYLLGDDNFGDTTNAANTQNQESEGTGTNNATQSNSENQTEGTTNSNTESNTGTNNAATNGSNTGDTEGSGSGEEITAGIVQGDNSQDNIYNPDAIE
jgi:stage V sporulation protein D (sporulation-specific penicillin-binding protein)